MNPTPTGGKRRRAAGGESPRGKTRLRVKAPGPKRAARAWHGQTEERFRQLINHSSDIITILDRNGVIRYESPSVERVLGYTPEELIGRQAFDLIHPDDVGKVRGLFAARRSVPGVAPSIEFRLRHKDGSWRTLEALGNNLVSQPGLDGVIVNSRDITERHEADRRTAVLLDIAETVSGTLDLAELLDRVQRRAAAAVPCDMVATFCRDRVARVVRLTAQYGVPDEILSLARAIEFPPGEPFGGRVLGGETLVINDMTEQKWLTPQLYEAFGIAAMIVTPLHVRGNDLGALVAVRRNPAQPFGTGEVSLFRGIARQLAVAIEGAELLRTKEEEGRVSAALARMGRELISSLDTPVLLDRLCRVTTEVLQCDCSHTLLLQSDQDVFVPVAGYGDPPEYWQLAQVIKLPRALLAPLLAELERRDVVSVDYTTCTRDLTSQLASQYGITAALYVAVRHGGQIIGIQDACFRGGVERLGPLQERIGHGIAQLTSLALANARLIEQLERANRLKSDFVATMSHELRTPLNVIIGYNDLLLEQSFGPLNGEQGEALRRMERSAHELLELINTTLDLGRLETGRLPVEISDVDVHDLLREIDAETGELRDKRGVQFTWDTAAVLPPVRSDRLKLKVIIKNLIANAMKFTAAGTVTVQTRGVDDGLEIVVHDTGIGMAPEILPIIFEPFRQAESSMTRRYGGVGLGLYIARRFLDLLNGTIAVESTPGQGSTFRVWIPAQTTGGETKDAVPGGGRREAGGG